jgi:hypothetical protein
MKMLMCLILLEDLHSNTWYSGSKLTFAFKEDANRRKGGYTYNNIDFSDWTHVCVVLDQDAETVSVYIDGIPVSVVLDNNQNMPTINNTSPLYIGKNPGVSSKPYYGLIDDVCLYNWALTNLEIQNIAQQ